MVDKSRHIEADETQAFVLNHHVKTNVLLERLRNHLCELRDIVHRLGGDDLGVCGTRLGNESIRMLDLFLERYEDTIESETRPDDELRQHGEAQCTNFSVASTGEAGKTRDRRAVTELLPHRLADRSALKDPGNDRALEDNLLFIFDRVLGIAGVLGVAEKEVGSELRDGSILRASHALIKEIEDAEDILLAWGDAKDTGRQTTKFSDR